MRYLATLFLLVVSASAYGQPCPNGQCAAAPARSGAPASFQGSYFEVRYPGVQEFEYAPAPAPPQVVFVIHHYAPAVYEQRSAPAYYAPPRQFGQVAYEPRYAPAYYAPQQRGFGVSVNAWRGQGGAPVGGFAGN